jgi:hypothetical protein
VHRIANVLDKLSTRLQPQAKRALHEMMYAASRAACEAAMARFTQDYEAKYPKAVKALVADVPRLLTHFDPRLSTLRKLAKALKVTVCELLGEEPKKGGR